MTKSWQPTQAWSFNGSWNDKKKIYERYHWKNQSNLNKDCTERTEFLSVILLWLAYEDREGNGTPLQYSCPENPRDGGAWQAAVYGVAQNRTRLKRLSSSSSSSSSSSKRRGALLTALWATFRRARAPPVRPLSLFGLPSSLPWLGSSPLLFPP